MRGLREGSSSRMSVRVTIMELSLDFCPFCNGELPEGINRERYDLSQTLTLV